MFRFDCHAHVYERVVPVGRPRYVPARAAPLAAWTACLDRHGLSGGVIVQPSFFGTDNSETLGALSRLDRRRFAAVAVVAPDADAQTLADLAQAGVRGVRWNLVEGAALPDPAAPDVLAFLTRLAAAGLHLEVQLEAPRLAGWIGRVCEAAGRVVVDHYGRPSGPPETDPFIAEARRLGPSSGLFVKLSAPYRSVATPAHAAALREALGPGRLVWGSDWPFTRHENAATYSAMAAAGRLAFPEDDGVAAHALYGLRP